MCESIPQPFVSTDTEVLRFSSRFATCKWRPGPAPWFLRRFPWEKGSWRGFWFGKILGWRFFRGEICCGFFLGFIFWGGEDLHIIFWRGDDNHWLEVIWFQNKRKSLALILPSLPANLVKTFRCFFSAGPALSFSISKTAFKGKLHEKTNDFDKEIPRANLTWPSDFCVCVFLRWFVFCSSWMNGTGRWVEWRFGGRQSGKSIETWKISGC